MRSAEKFFEGGIPPLKMFQSSKMPARSAENLDFLPNFSKNDPIFQHLKQFFIFSPNISQNFPKFLEVVQNICHLRHVFRIPPLKFEIPPHDPPPVARLSGNVSPPQKIKDILKKIFVPPTKFWPRGNPADI